MKKQTFTAALLSALLITAVAGTGLVDLAKSNPVGTTYYPPPYVKPPSNPPTISISSPKNNTRWSMRIDLVFTVTIPAEADTQIAAVFYNLDGSDNYLKYSGNGAPGQSSMRFTHTLIGLSEGKHSITVYASCERYTTYKSLWSFDTGVVYDIAVSDAVLGHSDEIQFGVNALPLRVTILSLENETYNNGEAPLDFTVSKAVSWMGYSLDEQPTTTITGNTTLTGLSAGTHDVIVYANDTVGNNYRSKIVQFSIAGETELQSTASEPFPTTLVAASVTTIAVVSTSVLFYFKKRNH